MPGWRTLGLCWLVLLVAAGAGAGALQALGPLPSAPKPVAASPPSEPPVAPVPSPPIATPASATVPVAPATQPPPAGPAPTPSAPASPPNPVIAGPDPALLEPAKDVPDGRLPRIAADGRTPMQVYAPSVDATDQRPRVALLLVGIGLSDTESWIAINNLPAGVTLGVSPYSPNVKPLLDQARARGHEFLVTIPMESQGYPLNDSGPHALLTGAEPADNAHNLRWVLSRVEGAAGATGASDGLRGERFANAAGLFADLQAELAQRGLLYVDPRPGATVSGAELAVTTIVDDPPLRPAISSQLAALEQRARDGKPAIGLAGPLRPVTVEVIANWARGLGSRGITLVPVSAMLPSKAP